MLIKTIHVKHSSPKYNMEGLTAGEILAIRNALNAQRRENTLGAVGKDVLTQVDLIYEKILAIPEP